MTTVQTPILASTNEFGDGGRGLIANAPVIAFDAAGEALTLASYLESIEHGLKEGRRAKPVELGWAHGTRLVRVSEIVDVCRRYDEPKYTIICDLKPDSDDQEVRR